MRLGNSLGKNKGKKYLRKDKIDIVFATKADSFNKWFEKNYNSLILFFKDRGFFDNDIFNTTYLNIYDKILFGGLYLDNYKSYLIRAYYTNYILDKSTNSERNNRFSELLPNLDKQDIDNEYILEIEEKQKTLEASIMEYVYSKYPIQEFELFKMYVSLKPAVNYATLAQITQLKAHNIQRTISKIKIDIQNNKEFAQRRKELI